MQFSFLCHHNKYPSGFTISLLTWAFGIYDAVIKAVNIFCINMPREINMLLGVLN